MLKTKNGGTTLLSKCAVCNCKKSLLLKAKIILSQNHRKLFYGGGGGVLVKISVTMVDQERKIKEKTLAKTP